MPGPLQLVAQLLRDVGKGMADTETGNFVFK